MRCLALSMLLGAMLGCGNEVDMGGPQADGGPSGQGGSGGQAGSGGTGGSAGALNPCPEQGSGEPAGGTCDFTGTCGKGQECCCGQCYPSLICTCEGGVISCAYTDACMMPACPDAGPDAATDAPDPGSCESLQNLPNPIGAACSFAGLCDVGQECCCGQCYPSLSCTCVDGTTTCAYTDACMIPACPDAGPDATTDGPEPGSCEALQTLPDPATMVCTFSGSCGVGQECCCGQCYPSRSCTCEGGVVSCAYTDACMIPACPDAGAD